MPEAVSTDVGSEARKKRRRLLVSKETNPWVLRMRATSLEEPAYLLKCLGSTIPGNGGWILSRGCEETGLVDLAFEFERRNCVEIYGALIAAGLELSQRSHLQLTELCQCTRNRESVCGSEIASVELEILAKDLTETAHVMHL